MCPGALTRACGSTLTAERDALFELARTGKIILSQRGKTVPPVNLKGTFRVRLKRAD